jgi:membrane-bound lytic murein transglycosylase D
MLVLFLSALLLAAVACGPSARTAATRPEPPPPPKREEPAPKVVFPEADTAIATRTVPWAIATAYTPEIEAVLQEAERRFRAGESFYQQGDTANARRQFDGAIDALLKAPEDALDRFRSEEMCGELVDAIYAYDVEGLGASASEPGFESSPLDELLAATFPVDPNIEMNVKERLKLPVSELPLTVNGEVMRYINYFSSTRGRKTLVNGLRRLGRYQPMIQRILQEEGVPKELMYLAQAESGYQARAVSRKRATGMWQFTRTRGAEYGLHRTSYYDDRLDPEKATRAAARHLRDLYQQLGDWYLAMAAYNGGPARITRAARRTGYADFWVFHERGVLPRETRRYVPLILATVIMAENPGEYGLEGIVPDPPIEYNTIDMTADTHLGLIADILGKPLPEIRALNPAILKDTAPVGYAVHVPKGTGSFVMAAVETVPASKRADWRVHRVGYGETLAQIADLYSTTAEKIAVANGGALTAPEAGDFVVVPVSYTPTRGARKTQPRPSAKTKRTSGLSTSSGSVQSGG